LGSIALKLDYKENNIMSENKLMSVWEVRFYEVWGNSDEGYWVNDISYIIREYPLKLNVEKFNEGSPLEFYAAYPSDEQIKDIFGIDEDQELILDGDDINIYVNLDDYYPIGELRCLDYSSLSPIGKRSKEYALNEYDYN